MELRDYKGDLKMTEVHFNPEIQSVVRSDQCCYTEAEKSKTEEVIEISFDDAAKSEKVKSSTDNVNDLTGPCKDLEKNIDRISRSGKNLGKNIDRLINIFK